MRFRILISLLVVTLLCLFAGLQAQVTPVVRGTTPTSSNCLGTDGSGHVTSCSMSPASLWTGTTDPGVPIIPSVRQFIANSNNPAAFSSSVVSGNYIFVTLFCYCSTTPTITDTRSTTWTNVASRTGTGSGDANTIASVTYAGVLGSSGAETITVSAAAGYGELAVEVANANSLDLANVGPGANPPSITTTAAYDGIFVTAVGVNQSGVASATAPVVMVDSSTGGYGNHILATLSTTTTGAYSPVATMGSGAIHYYSIGYKAIPIANPGANGDMYLNLTSHHMWGPKAGGNWSDTGLLTPSPTVGGDLSGTIPNPTVAKVNGATVPTSAAVVGTNSSGQIVSAPSHGMVQITQTTLGTTAANITFSSIPQTYSSLKIIMVARASGSSGSDCWLRFNADSGTNYMRSYAGGAASGIQGNQTGQAQAAIGPLDFSTDTAGAFATFDVIVTSYTNTSVWKGGVSTAGNFGGASNPMYLSTWYVWRSTAAVTSIVLQPSDGTNFVAGTQATLYGIL